MCCNDERSAGSESLGKALKPHVSPGSLSKIKAADYTLKIAAVFLTYLQASTYSLIVTCSFAYFSLCRSPIDSQNDSFSRAQNLLKE